MTETHLDHDVLSALQEVMEGEYPLLLDAFLADSEERLRLLHKAGDATQIIDAAHSFKGSSSNMGAVRLARLCHELEQRAKETSPAVIERLVGEIDGEFAIVRPLYEAERQRS
ncbi:Hpt domain protein [compost metagenome]